MKDSRHLGSKVVWSSGSCGEESKNGLMTEQRAVRLFQWCFLHHRVEEIIADRGQLRPSGGSNRSNLLFELLQLKLATGSSHQPLVCQRSACYATITPTHPRVSRIGQEDLADTSS